MSNRDAGLNLELNYPLGRPGAAGALGKRRENLPRQLLGHAVHQPRADLGELSTDIRLGGVGEQSAAILRRQGDARLAPGKSGSAALTLEAEGISARRIRIRHGHFSLELRAHGADLGEEHDLVLVLALRLDALAARDAVLEDDGIVERVPGLLLGEGNELLAGHFHINPSWRFSCWWFIRVCLRSSAVASLTFQLWQAREPGLPGSRYCAPAGNRRHRAAW